MLNHNRGLARLDLHFRLARQMLRLGECYIPALLALDAEVLVYDVRRQDCIDEQLAKALEFILGLGDRASAIDKGVLHEQVPSNVYGFLFSDACSCKRRQYSLVLGSAESLERPYGRHQSVNMETGHLLSSA